MRCGTGAVGSGDALDQPQVGLGSAFAHAPGDRVGTCNHSRPTWIALDRVAIEKLFGRR